MAILLQGPGASHVVGAGTPFGNGDDDFAWIDFWTVEDRGTRRHSYVEKSITLKADGLMVTKEGSASALIYMRNGRLVWQQQGD